MSLIKDHLEELYPEIEIESALEKSELVMALLVAKYRNLVEREFSNLKIDNMDIERYILAIHYDLRLHDYTRLCPMNFGAKCKHFTPIMDENYEHGCKYCIFIQNCWTLERFSKYYRKLNEFAKNIRKAGGLLDIYNIEHRYRNLNK